MEQVVAFFEMMGDWSVGAWDSTYNWLDTWAF